MPVGLLVTCMAAAEQEIPPALQALALKDPRFRKTQTRNKAGGVFSASGSKRRVRATCCRPIFKIYSVSMASQMCNFALG